jgi:predicted ATP-dependent Lon-type protease
MKILFPHGEMTQEELAEMLEFALEGRPRVKEQLNKMGSFEYYRTSFSYTLQETGEEKFVGVPEQGGRDLISTDPLSPGTVYTAGVTSDGTVGLYRLEVSVSSGTGKLKMADVVSGVMKESIQRACAFTTDFIQKESYIESDSTPSARHRQPQTVQQPGNAERIILRAETRSFHSQRQGLPRRRQPLQHQSAVARAK